MAYRTAVVALMVSLLFGITARAEIILSVSPKGVDENSGSVEAPLATLTGARDRIRQLRMAGHKDGVRVLFAAGRYVLDRAVAFEKQDSGTTTSPIVYSAKPGDAVRITGARPVRDFVQVTDNTVLQNIPEAARTHVLVADLKKSGISEFGQLTVHGFAKGSQPAESELFYNDLPMTLARWPNDSFRGVVSAEGVERVFVDSDRVERWCGESDPWLFAYWHHDWAELHEPIVGIVPEDYVLVRSKDVRPQYGVTAGRARWYAYNLLSEIDSPGEYYLDRQAGLLYFWPPQPDGTAELSQATSLIECNEVSHLSFEGFTFDGCRGTAVRINQGIGCSVVGCILRNVGHRAVYATGGVRHKVYGCDISQCGEGGILLSGGDRASLQPARHIAANNHVHDYSRRARTYKPGISVSGVGNRIAHNLIHHGPHMALSASGNDHIVEFNEIHNVVYESGDAGAYYVGRDWTQRGNILRFNYWHQIVGATGHGGMTIYLDDQHSGHTIHGNIFERCSRAVFIGGGDDNIVTNNVFLDCWRAAHIDNRGMGWQKQATDDPNGTLRTRLRAMPVDNPLWRSRYPNLERVLQDEPNIPKRNVFERNISAGGTWDDIHAGTRTYQTVRNNLVFDDDKQWVQLVKDDAGRLVELRFKDEAVVRKIGFDPLPLERIGLYHDPRRVPGPIQRVIDKIDLPD